MFSAIAWAAAQVRAPAQTAVLVKQLRAAWERLLAERVRRPGGELTAPQQALLQLITEMIQQHATEPR